MVNKDDFEYYISEVAVSSKTGQSLSKRVVSNTLSRARRIEKATGCQLTHKLCASEERFQALLSQIIYLQLGVTEANPYAYASYVYTANLYRRFSEWFKANEGLY